MVHLDVCKEKSEETLLHHLGVRRVECKVGKVLVLEVFVAIPCPYLLLESEIALFHRIQIYVS